jgi:glutathione S-transferase
MSLELELDFAHRPFRFDRQLSVSDLWFPCTVNRIPEERIQLHLGDADRGARIAMK